MQASEQPPTHVEVDVHPGPECSVYVDGTPEQEPILVISSPLADVMISPPTPTVTEADVAAGDALAQAAAEYAARLRGLHHARTEHAARLP